HDTSAAPQSHALTRQSKRDGDHPASNRRIDAIYLICLARMKMSNLEVMSADALRVDRTIGFRWLRRAPRSLMLAKHGSRRRKARRMLAEFSHLRAEF